MICISILAGSVDDKFVPITKCPLDGINVPFGIRKDPPVGVPKTSCLKPIKYPEISIAEHDLLYNSIYSLPIFPPKLIKP